MDLECVLCRYVYDTVDAFEYHLKKEHTKNEMIHYLKMQQVKNRGKKE